MGDPRSYRGRVDRILIQVVDIEVLSTWDYGIPENVMNREQAEDLLFEMTKTDSLRRHARTVELAMRHQARPAHAISALQPHAEELGIGPH